MKRYPNLDVIRAYAALSVLAAHIPEMAAGWYHVPVANIPFAPFFLGASDGVSLFFVLSGWLIGGILLREHDATGTVDVKRFQWRRLVRIWPVYFLAVGVGLALAPVLSYPAALFTALLLPNIGRALFGLPSMLLGHLWSIGVEEQAYLGLPLLLRRYGNLPAICMGIIVVKAALLVLAPDSELLLYARFEAIAAGALMAWVYERRHWLLGVLYHPAVVVAVGAFFVAIIAVDAPELVSAYDFTFAAMAAVLILNAATNPRLPRIDNAQSRFAGSLSYSIYAYHPAIIWVLGQHIDQVDAGFYALVLDVSLVLSMLSLVVLERPFLRLKDRLAQPSARRINTVTCEVST